MILDKASLTGNQLNYDKWYLSMFSDDISSRSAKRGVDSEDNKWFSVKERKRLSTAQEEIKWLLDRGYKMSTVSEFVGGHYQLSVRQRTALQRATGSEFQQKQRKAKLLPLSAVKEGCIYIDGFNLIITLEVALSGGVLILCNDDTIRDLAGLRGTYSIIDKTDKALEILGNEFLKLKVSSIKFFLDAPVSNSGRLKSRILKHAEYWDLPVEAELVPNADRILESMERVVTSDSVILDHCISWLNISRKVIEDYVKDANIIELNK